MVVLLVVAGCAIAAVVLSLDRGAQSSLVVDQAVVEEWERTVTPGLDDLNSRGLPPRPVAAARATALPDLPMGAGS
ncbi:exported hypothetical protein [metagenome]|uniref:Uncharacterized protein n=1 Tax=metagenome TaxID=256318 RepID=A0A2P2C5Y5_9ZZZZ